MYRERTSQGFDFAPASPREAASPSNELRDYLRSGRFKVVHSAPLVRPAPAPPKRHVLVLQRCIQNKSNQRFEFEPEGFDVTLTHWRPGTPLGAATGLVSLIVVDFEDGVYADTAVYPILQGAFPGVPVIILAASEDPIDRIVALELGADDFMSKPAHPRELQARVRAILKHMPGLGAASSATWASYRGIHLDLVDRAATTERGRARLRNVEFWLLQRLIEAQGREVARETLLACLETEAGESHRDSRSVDVNISRLRNKIDMPGRESLIQTVRGYGYRI